MPKISALQNQAQDETTKNEPFAKHSGGSPKCQAELLRSGELRQVIETMKPGISWMYNKGFIGNRNYLEFEGVFFLFL